MGDESLVLGSFMREFGEDGLDGVEVDVGDDFLVVLLGEEQVEVLVGLHRQGLTYGSCSGCFLVRMWYTIDSVVVQQLKGMTSLAIS